MKNIENVLFSEPLKSYVDRVLEEHRDVTQRMEAVLAGNILDRCFTHKALIMVLTAIGSINTFLAEAYKTRQGSLEASEGMPEFESAVR